VTYALVNTILSGAHPKNGLRFLGTANRQVPPNFEPASDLFGCPVRKNGEVLGLLAVLDFPESFGRKPALEQLPYGRSSARHPFCEAPCINRPKFLGREHDLKAFTSIDFTHPTVLA
jgi:hypothetical protein